MDTEKYRQGGLDWTDSDAQVGTHKEFQQHIGLPDEAVRPARDGRHDAQDGNRQPY